jgi:hypothetical protein
MYTSCWNLHVPKSIIHQAKNYVFLFYHYDLNGINFLCYFFFWVLSFTSCSTLGYFFQSKYAVSRQRMNYPSKQCHDKYFSSTTMFLLPCSLCFPISLQMCFFSSLQMCFFSLHIGIQHRSGVGVEGGGLTCMTVADGGLRWEPPGAGCGGGEVHVGAVMWHGGGEVGALPR